MNILEKIDISLWTQLFEVNRTVPHEMLYLELGIEPLSFIVMRRRINYLQHILKQDENRMIHSFLITQMERPKKNDWIVTVKGNLEYLDIMLTFEDIKNMSKPAFKKLVKLKTRQKAFEHLQKLKSCHSKVAHIPYEKLSMQSYLLPGLEDISNDERKYIFQARSRMLGKIKNNYRNKFKNILCIACGKAECSQQHAMLCPKLLGRNKILSHIPAYEQLFGTDLSEQVYVVRIIKENLRNRTQLYGDPE